MGAKQVRCRGGIILDGRFSKAILPLSPASSPSHGSQQLSSAHPHGAYGRILQVQEECRGGRAGGREQCNHHQLNTCKNLRPRLWKDHAALFLVSSPTFRSRIKLIIGLSIS
jgi:hypothetical protein